MSQVKAGLFDDPQSFVLTFFKCQAVDVKFWRRFIYAIDAPSKDKDGLLLRRCYQSKDVLTSVLNNLKNISVISFVEEEAWQWNIVFLVLSIISCVCPKPTDLEFLWASLVETFITHKGVCRCYVWGSGNEVWLYPWTMNSVFFLLHNKQKWKKHSKLINIHLSWKLLCISSQNTSLLCFCHHVVGPCSEKCSLNGLNK